MDVFSKAKRSEVMSRIRGADTKSTERRLAALLRAHGVAGWRLRDPNVLGRPDIYFSKARIAVFVDGCFWHGCRRCFTMPAQNRPFWKSKIAGNIQRDRLVNRRLKRAGTLVIRLWEHELERETPRLGAVIRLLATAAKTRSPFLVVRPVRSRRG